MLCGTSPRDPQLFHRLATVLADKQHKVQIGNNDNLIDYAYVGNVADAHILAADRLPFALDSKAHPVAGQAFFITNGEPIRIWDFNRLAWRGLGAPASDLDPANVTRIPRWIAMILAVLSEGWAKVTGGTTEFSLLAVRFITATQWYNIDKVIVQSHISLQLHLLTIPCTGSLRIGMPTKSEFRRCDTTHCSSEYRLCPPSILLNHLSVVGREGRKGIF